MRFFSSLTLSVLLILFALPVVKGSQPYGGIWYDMDSRGTWEVFAISTFTGTHDPSVIGSNNWVSPVISSAGSIDGNSVSGYVYQNNVVLFSDGHVDSAPQVWLGTSRLWAAEMPVGDRYTTNMITRMGFIAANPRVVRFFTEVCQTAADCNAGRYKDYLWYPDKVNDLSNDPDTMLMAGTFCYNPGLFGCEYNVRTLQWGIESVNVVKSSQWGAYMWSGAYMGNQPPAYPNGYWYYSAARAADGDISVNKISVYQGYTECVGCASYQGLNGGYYDNGQSSTQDNVYWYYYGTTLSEGTPLWPNGGGVSPPPG